MMIQRRHLLAAGGALVLGGGARHAAAQGAPARITYLFPAPPTLPAFVPHQLAQARGHFAAEGVQVTYQTGRGGADVATQLGAGNAEIGGGLGETSMIVRANGLPVRAVALLGGRPLVRIAVRRTVGVKSVAELRGKRIGVLSLQDTTFYALLGAMAGNGLRRADAQIQPVGPAGITQLMISGNLDAITATPEWADTIEQAGIPLDYFEIDAVFPAMAQAILSSDRVIRERPAAVRGVVNAILKALRETIADPAAAAKDFCAAVPQWAGKEVEIERIVRVYDDLVYRTTPPDVLGRFDPERLRVVQRFYIENGIVQTAVPIEELYTNEFVGG